MNNPLVNIQMSAREKRVVMLAALVALVLVVTNLFPALQRIYDSRQQNIESLELDLAREERLTENTAQWRERRIAAETRRDELAAQTFSGATVPVIEANIQRALSQHARDAGITVSSTRLADRLETAGWILISQEMSFRTSDAGNTVEFLRQLETSSPRLHVTHFNLSHTRTQYNGAITVVGFARSESIGNNDE